MLLKPTGRLKPPWLLLLLAYLSPPAASRCNLTIRHARLADGVVPQEGRLELLVGCAGSAATWRRTLCQTAVGVRDWPEHGVHPDLLARVICRQLGFGGGVQKRFRPPPAVPQLEGEVRCTGREAAVAACNATEMRTEEPEYCATQEWEDMDGGYEAGAVCNGVLPASVVSSARLTGGPTPREGRLELRINGVWGTVCNRNVTDMAAAQVVCRQLGYDGAAAPRAGGFYNRQQSQLLPGIGGLPTLLEIVRCQGSEPGLHACTVSRTVDTQDCSHSADFGVWCRGRLNSAVAGVRLVGGLTPHDGMLQVQVDGRWGAVCPFGMSTQDVESNGFALARAACLQLGFAGAGRPQVGIYGVPPPLAALHNVFCPASASSLDECSYTWSTTPCLNGNWESRDLNLPWGQPWYAAVSCQGARPRIRLAGGESPKEGRVEVWYDNRWRPICNGGPGVAKVVCRQLGLGGGVDRPASLYGPASMPTFVSASCFGSEHSLLACALGLPVDTYDGRCPSPMGVACQGATTIRGVRIADGPSKIEGRVEVYIGDKWATAICSGCFEPSVGGPVARTICRSLGYAGGVLRHDWNYKGFYGAGKLVLGLDVVRCPPGGQASLNDCAFQALSPEANMLERLAVACDGSNPVRRVRLVDGPNGSMREGRVEVFMEGGWGYVNADGAEEARLVCRLLGMGGGAPRLGTFYGKGLLPRKLEIRCSGGEPHLGLCSLFRPSKDETWADFFGVACAGAHTVTGVRLMNFSTPAVRAGRLELRLAGGGWTPMCRWADLGKAGGVACRMLGFSGGSQPAYNSWNSNPNNTTGPPMRFGGTVASVALRAIGCSGSERSLSQCLLDLQPDGSAGCEGGGVVEVTCA